MSPSRPPRQRTRTLGARHAVGVSRKDDALRPHDRVPAGSRPCRRHVGASAHRFGEGSDDAGARSRLGGETPPPRAVWSETRPCHVISEDGHARPRLPRRKSRRRDVPHTRAKRDDGPCRYGRDDRNGGYPRACHDARPASGRLHQGCESEEQGLHRRLGPSEAERPDPANGPVQGPVSCGRRKGRETDRRAVASQVMQKVIERILNLLAFLLTVNRPVSADEIRNTVAGYDRDSDTAFHRTFERDKALLRRLGIPIEREATDVFEVEFGYVVDNEQYALADPGLSDEERVALSLAVQAVGFGGRPFGQEALMKLGGGAGGTEGTQLGADLGEQADAVATAFAAISERRILAFDYRGAPRRVRPYGLVHRRGHWYLVASEAATGTIKVFRPVSYTHLRAHETVLDLVCRLL